VARQSLRQIRADEFVSQSKKLLDATESGATLLNVCSQCHTSGRFKSAPYFDFYNLKKIKADHGLVEEINFRLSPAARKNQMPPDGGLSKDEKSRILNYLSR
jgi:hypothetical protein